jgi:hypothetical protein
MGMGKNKKNRSYKMKFLQKLKEHFFFTQKKDMELPTYLQSYLQWEDYIDEALYNTNSCSSRYILEDMLKTEEAYSFHKAMYLHESPPGSLDDLLTDLKKISNNLELRKTQAQRGDEFLKALDRL